MKKIALLVIIASLTVCAVAHAGLRNFQTAKVTADGQVANWMSKPIKNDDNVFVMVFRGKEELTQRWANVCTGFYVGGGVMVKVRVRYCQQDVALNNYVVRYVSVTGKQPLRIQLVH